MTPPAGGPQAWVLIVEDQPELQRALRINLRARQYDVLPARTGREALALASSHPPDAIILDLGLPDGRARVPERARAGTGAYQNAHARKGAHQNAHARMATTLRAVPTFPARFIVI